MLERAPASRRLLVVLLICLLSVMIATVFRGPTPVNFNIKLTFGPNYFEIFNVSLIHLSFGVSPQFLHRCRPAACRLDDCMMNLIQVLLITFPLHHIDL